MQEFHIWLTPVEQDSYLVQTQQVAPGVPLAEERITLSLEDLLTQAHELHSLQAVLKDDIPLAAADANIINLGKQLYNVIFPGSIRDSWLIAQEIAQNQQEVLRLCLKLAEPMAKLPWKIIHTGDYFLATDPHIAFSYYLDPAMIPLPHPCPPEQDDSDVLPALDTDLLDEDWDEEIDLESDDAYEEDSALVSDLFRQLHNQPTAVSAIVPEANLEQLPEVAVSAPDSHSTDKSNLAEAPLIPSENTCITSKQEVKKTRFPGAVQIPIFQAVGVIGIALVGLWWFQQPPKFSPPISPSPTANANLNASDSQLQAIAIKNFNNGNLSAGSLAVEELLNRGALESAAAALSNVSAPQAQTSSINFLRGRLAWQFIKVGDKKYNLNDVRSYWETAVKSQPNSLKYHNALAFLYYIQGDLNKANQTWFQALYLVEEQEQTTTAKSNPALSKRDQLNTYAGLALVLSKSAQAQPSDQQVRLLSEAIKLRQKVLTQDPVNFQPQTLSKTWLWTEKAIQDWRSLLKKQI